MVGTDIFSNPLHLGRGATAEVEPKFTGEPSWYEDYVKRHDGDGAEARLVGMGRFTGTSDHWEMHPHGSEVVLCITGSIMVHQELSDGSRRTITLVPGQYAINGPGTWHTVDAENEATVLAITPCLGTEVRMR